MSINGAQWHAAPSFSYYEEPTVGALSPPILPAGSACLVALELGAALPSGPDYAPKCRFAGKEGASEVATGTLAAGETAVRCTTPATGVADGPIGVELSLNGQQYTSSPRRSHSTRQRRRRRRRGRRRRHAGKIGGTALTTARPTA